MKTINKKSKCGFYECVLYLWNNLVYLNLLAYTQFILEYDWKLMWLVILLACHTSYYTERQVNLVWMIGYKEDHSHAI